MSMTAQGKNASLAAGKLYFDRFTAAGVSTGERFLGNCSAFAASMSVETKEKYDSSSAARTLLASAVTKVTGEFSITCDEWTAKNIALWALGAADTLAQTGGTITDELLNGGVAVPSADAYYALANRNVSAVSVKVLSASKALHTDYEVDAVSGRIYIVDGGTIVPGTDIVKVSYTAAALSGASALDRVKGGTVGQILGLLRYVGDPNAGPAEEMLVYKGSLTPDGEMAFIGDDFGNFKLKGKMLADGVHTELFTVIKIG